MANNTDLDRILWDQLVDELDTTALPLPSGVPCAAHIERGAVTTRDDIQAAMAKAAALEAEREELCTVRGCAARTLYVADGGEHYCAGHALEFHMGEDREEFAESYARDMAAE